MNTVTTNKQLIPILMKLKTISEYRIIWKLIKDVQISERDLCSLLKKTETVVQKMCRRLEDIKLIRRLSLVESKEIFYVIDIEFYNINNLCLKCKYKKIIDIPSIKSKSVSCIKKGKRCVYDDIRIGNNILKNINKHSERKPCNIIERQFSGGSDKKYIDQWNGKDFNLFFIKEFSKTYKDLISPQTSEIRINMEKLMKVFRENIGDDWRRLCKQYIINSFQIYSNNQKILTVYQLLDSKVINAFLIGRGKKIKRIEFCTIKDLRCSYFLAGICQLKKNNIECTEQIVSEMMGKFN